MRVKMLRAHWRKTKLDSLHLERSTKSALLCRLIVFASMEAERGRTMLNALLEIRKVAATDRGRYAIKGVLLKADKRRVHAVATDGKRMICAHLPGEHGDSEGIYVVPKTLPKQLKTISGKTLHNCAATVDMAPEEGRFPRYQRAIPKVNSKRVATFSISVLAETLKTLGAMTGCDVVDLYAPKREGSAWLVVPRAIHGAPNGVKACGIVMPFSG